MMRPTIEETLVAIASMRHVKCFTLRMVATKPTLRYEWEATIGDDRYGASLEVGGAGGVSLREAPRALLALARMSLEKLA